MKINESNKIIPQDNKFPKRNGNFYKAKTPIRKYSGKNNIICNTNNNKNKFFRIN